MATGTEAHAATHALEPYAATWRSTCLGVLAVWLVVGCVYWPTLLSMMSKWHESGTFAHGFLILPIAVYFGWRERHAFLSEAPAPALWALLLLGGAATVWLIGDLAAVLVLQQAALVAILELILLTAFGVRATWALAFPLGFAWFAVPIGEFLTAPLQDFTAWFAVLGLRLSGVSVLVEGRALTLASGNWLVAEACSGVRYVIPSFALGVLFAWMTYRSWTRRTAFVLLSIVLPVFANGFRAYAIIMLAHLSDNKLAVGIDHMIYGWVFFAAVMLLLFVAGSRWREDFDDEHPHEQEAATARLSRSAARMPLAIMLATIIALCPPTLSATLFADAPAGRDGLVAPAAKHPWVMTAGSVLTPRFLGAAGEFTQSYSAGGSTVELYMAHYVTERQGEELINGENRVADRTQWMLIDTRTTEARVNGEVFTVQQDTIRSRRGAATRVVWIWYWVSGKRTLSPIEAKRLRAQTRLLRRPYDAAAIMISAEQNPDHPAEVILQDFLDHCPLLAQPLMGSRDPA